MIVNTSYIYMGSGGAAVNPNLWQDGVSNYPATFTGGCQISWDGLHMPSPAGDATFSELPLTNFNTLTITGRLFYDMPLQTNISIEFYSRDNVLIGGTTMRVSTFGDTAAINIPSSAKIKNARIKIKKDTTAGTYITLSSAVLS